MAPKKAVTKKTTTVARREEEEQPREERRVTLVPPSPTRGSLLELIAFSRERSRRPGTQPGGTGTFGFTADLDSTHGSLLQDLFGGRTGTVGRLRITADYSHGNTWKDSFTQISWTLAIIWILTIAFVFIWASKNPNSSYNLPNVAWDAFWSYWSGVRGGSGRPVGGRADIPPRDYTAS